jgi:hypothetical protein
VFDVTSFARLCEDIPTYVWVLAETTAPSQRNCEVLFSHTTPAPSVAIFAPLLSTSLPIAPSGSSPAPVCLSFRICFRVGRLPPGYWTSCSGCSSHDMCLCCAICLLGLHAVCAMVSDRGRSCYLLPFPYVDGVAASCAVCRSVLVCPWVLRLFGGGMVLISTDRLAFRSGVFLWCILSVCMLPS